MSRDQSVLKTFLSLLLSATMAIPATSYAKNDGFLPAPEVTEDLPVVAQEIVINGKPATIFAYPVPRSMEVQFVTNIVRNRPENVVLQVSGENDPALKAAAATPQFKYTSTFVTSPFTELAARERSIENNLDKAPSAFSDKSPKKTFWQKVKALTQTEAADEAVGLAFGVLYSGIQGGFTYYASSSVEAGLAVFGMYTLWNSFILLKPDYWGKVLEMGGNALVNIGKGVARLTGKELSDRDKRIYEVVGKFAVSWGVTAAQGGYVKHYSGDLEGLGLAEIFISSSVSGVQNNYNIWDAVVLKNNSDGGWFTKKRTKWYFRHMMWIGAVLESLAFRGVPGVGLFLTTATGMGVLYLALNPEKQVALTIKAREFSVAFRSGVATIRKADREAGEYVDRRMAYVVKVMKSSCENLLDNKPKRRDRMPLQHRYVYEDIQ